MTPFSISGLLAGIFSLGFGLFVLFKTKNRNLGRIWFLFTLSACGWGFGSFWIGFTHNYEEGMLAWKLAYAFGVIWIAPLFYHFTCTFLNRSKKFVAFHYTLGVLFLFLLPTNLFFGQIRYMFNAYYFPIAGKLFGLYFCWWIGIILYSHFLLYKAYKKLPRYEGNQIKYFFIATAAGFSGGTLCYLPNFGIEIYPWGNFTVFLYPIIMSYAILKYDLLEVRVLIRRTALLLVIYFGLILLGLPLILFLHQKAVNPPHISEILIAAEVILMGFILSLGPFIYAYFVKRNAYFHEHTIAGLTHELKSPLGVIDSATAALLDSLDEPKLDRKMLADYLSMIQSNTARLQGFAQNLIHAAKDQGDEMTLDYQPCDLADIFKTTCDHWKHQASKKGVSIIYEGVDSAPLNGDPVKLHQVVSNILSNSVKFSDSGRILVELQKEENQWKCAVSDEGRGVSPENLKKVFNRFYQEKPGFKGTGIGLTIAKAWVEAHGGKIWAESEGEGKGTMVRFTLPIKL